MQKQIWELATDPAVQAVIVHTSSSGAQDATLRSTLDPLMHDSSFLLVWLDLQSALEYSRVDFFYHLATKVLDATSVLDVPSDPDSTDPDSTEQSRLLLEPMSPTHFHAGFMEQVVVRLAPSQRLLFLFSGIDLQDRGRVSKLNNLFLPLLRRLARLERLKFILAVNADEPTQVQALFQPIFFGIKEVTLPPTMSTVAPSPQEPQHEDTVAQDPVHTNSVTDPAAASTPTKRRLLLLILLILIIIALLINIYFLLILAQST